MNLSQRQTASQIQAQRMGQKQIQAMRLLSLGAEDLREEILERAEQNPALEIVSDSFEEGLQSARYKNSPDGALRVASVSSAGEEKSDAFLEILESRPDERKSLYSHLAEQIDLLDISAAEKNLCKKIAGNLDERGFYILSPLSLLDKRAGETEALLQKCLGLVQSLDPSGVCAENVEKSLLLQARLKGNAPGLALFLLDGRLDFLDPPQAEKVLEKIRAFVREQKKLSFSKEDFSGLQSLSLSDAEEALAFIQGLDPFPARNYGQERTRYIAPDIYVEKSEEDGGGQEEGAPFKIRLSRNGMPRLRLAPDFVKAQKDSADARAAVEKASAFLESLAFRESAMEKAARAIVARQSDFFKNGPGRLVPLTMRELAQEIGSHESTVSRMASSKYLQCQWGLFPVKYFFSSAVSDSSKESVQNEIQKILDENAGKKLSDQKLADILAGRGISVARRTVAKYRSQMNVASSYSRDSL